MSQNLQKKKKNSDAVIEQNNTIPITISQSSINITHTEIYTPKYTKRWIKKLLKNQWNNNQKNYKEKSYIQKWNYFRHITLTKRTDPSQPLSKNTKKYNWKDSIKLKKSQFYHSPNFYSKKKKKKRHYMKKLLNNSFFP